MYSFFCFFFLNTRPVNTKRKRTGKKEQYTNQHMDNRDKSCVGGALGALTSRLTLMEIRPFSSVYSLLAL